MRIAILGSVALPVPPPAQGGTEWIAFYQVEGLAKLGHRVLLFAAKGSRKGIYELIEVGGGDTVVGSNIHPVILGTNEVRTPESDSGHLPANTTHQALQAGARMTNYTESSRNLRIENVYLAQVQQELIDRKDEYDLILNNMRGEAVFIPLAKLLGKPLINVMHLPIFPQLADIFKQFNTHVISISNAQRKEFPDLNYLATVYNCVDTQKYAYDPVGGDYLLMMGSIAPHKNQEAAIRVAKKLGMKLVLAGKIGNPDYFEKLKPDIDGENIKWKGEMEFEEKLHLYQKAKAFIFPINWPEPFGLVMIEAMSCGTPVVAFGNGAIPEVVVDGKIGFVIEDSSKSRLNGISRLDRGSSTPSGHDAVNDSPPAGGSQTASGQLTNNKEHITYNIVQTGEEGLVKAIETINSMSESDYGKMREDCRKHVEENFTVEKMVKDYEKALAKIV